MKSNTYPFSGCGIAGLMFKKTNVIPESYVEKFRLVLNALKHRGPDGSGTYCKANVILGHRRLSILDPSENGSQPMTKDDLTITLNGEIYNFQELQSDLKKDGIDFYSETDTEVVLRSYQKWGQAALQKFNGMFSFAIWDDTNKCLFIARDRLGKKPLYYYSNNQYFTFCSEIMPLLQAGLIPREVNYNSFDHQLFATSFLETDLTRTLVKNVTSLPPGHFMLLFPDGSSKIEKYWDIPEIQSYSEYTDIQILEKLEYLINDSIRLRMISDVPVSAFLSGGIDSSLINHYALFHTQKKLTSITITYKDGGHDPFSGLEDTDLKFSKDFIKSYTDRITHEVILLNNSGLTLEHIDEIIDIASISDDDRLLSILRNYKCVNNLGFKVVLNGQGADEIMGGYIGLKYFYETMFDIKRPELEIIKNMFPARTIIKQNILKSNVNTIRDTIYSNVYDYYFSLQGKPAERIHRFITKTQLLRILQLEDFLSMQCSVECRLPFLDYRLVELAFGIPFQKHMFPETRTGKVFLREIANKYLPPSISNRPKQVFPASHPEKKAQQLKSLFKLHFQEIFQCEVINYYFDKKEILTHEQDLSVNELWLLIVLWRWETAFKVR